MQVGDLDTQTLDGRGDIGCDRHDVASRCSRFNACMTSRTATAEVIVQRGVLREQSVVSIRGGQTTADTRPGTTTPSQPRPTAMSGYAPTATAAWIADPRAGPCSDSITESGRRRTSA